MMRPCVAPRLAATFTKRCFSSSPISRMHVAVLGASGGIGQPLSLLLKCNPKVSSLRLFDLRLGSGVAADLSHIDTRAKVTGFSPRDGDKDCPEEVLQDAQLVIIPAGMARKPGMTRDDLFDTNASIICDLAKTIAKVAPTAHVLVVTNPENSTVPIVAEVFKKAGVYNPKKLYGVTTLDVIRANTFLAANLHLSPSEVKVPVVGGHSGLSIVPLLSQAKHHGEANLTRQQHEEMINRIQFGGDEVLKAKDGAGTATLSMAYAAATFAESLIRACSGESGIEECAFVQSPLYHSEGIPFFASRVELGPDGIKNIHPVGEITEKEQELLDNALPGLKKDIEKGITWAQSNH